MAAKRVKRLKDLMELLEKLPATPDRDRMLSEVRSRAVDLDTGVAPRAMLPLREPAAPLDLAGPPKRQRASGITQTPPPVRPAIELAHPAWAPGRSKGQEQWLWGDARLSLEDAALPQAREPDNAVRPWKLGLRG
jgi:hypothetical protein